MNKPIPERVEEFAKNLSASVRKFAGYGQYPDDGVEQKAYRDGVETAIGMMYIDITGTPKTSGMLVPLLTETDQQARDEEKESKDSAYRERNMLVCALTKLFPAYLARHDESDESWERDWMWIVYIDLPTGQVSWHIHDSERGLFDHLEVKENNWDGHNTERKYQRLQALSALSNPPSQV